MTARGKERENKRGRRERKKRRLEGEKVVAWEEEDNLQMQDQVFDLWR